MCVYQYLGNSGTSARFLTGVVTTVKEAGGSVIVTGNKRMQQRPLKDMVDALRAHGCKIEYLAGDGCPPVRISSNGLPGGTIRLSATISSQFVSGILLAAPMAEGDVTLQLIEDKAISEPYIDMTIGMMKDFGKKISKVLYIVTVLSKYTGP
jgi:pentafunctional AROM polypeptide